MIKLIASDMDGTLLNNSSLVPEGNVAAILAAQKAGIQFIVATGRGRTEALPVLKKAGLTLPMITVNGAQVFDIDGKILFTIDIPQATVLEIIDVLRAHKLYFELATTKGTFSDSHAKRIGTTSTYIKNNHPEISEKMAIAMTAAHLELLNVNFVQDFKAVLADPDIKILKFIVFAYEDNSALEAVQAEIEKIPDLAITSSAKNNIEINNANATKGQAVVRVAKSLSISLDDVMCIGDNFNDVSMLEVAGVSFAMKNGPEAVHKKAKYLAENNVDAGVGQAIMRAMKEKL